MDVIGGLLQPDNTQKIVYSCHKGTNEMFVFILR